MRPNLAILLFAGLLAWPGVTPAAQFIEAPPLTRVTKTAVVACPAHDVLPLPVITWGGDIATIYANGNQADTGRASIIGNANLRVRLAREDVLSRQLDNA
jgi:hypothetical protein